MSKTTKTPHTIRVYNGTENVFVERKKRSFAYFTFQNNTETTVLTKDVWTHFANPTGGLVEMYDNNNDFTASETELKLTYTGTSSKWFNLSAVTNLFKDANGSATRTYDLQWKLNEVFVGFSRETAGNNEPNIYTGNGMIYLQENDYICPWVKNVENNNNALLDNASFTLSEEVMHYYE